MIKSNLATLLAERNLKITKVSDDTGISRTTLTSLSSGNAQGIQFETINTLCLYLSISPGDLFLYVPFDIVLSTEDFTLGESIMEFTVYTKSGQKTYYMGVTIDEEEAESTGTFTRETARYKRKVGIDICPCSDPTEEHPYRRLTYDSAQSYEFMDYYSKLPVAMEVALEKTIVNQVLHSLGYNPLETDVFFDISATPG